MHMNFLSPLEFQATIKRLPNIEFTVQKANVPSISVTLPEQGTPFNKIYFVPDKLTYSNLDLTFLVDEDMKNYREIFDWMHGISAPQSGAQYANINKSRDGVESDVELLILNSKKNAKIAVQFINCMPINLSDLNFDVTQTDIQYLEATVSFQVQSFSFRAL